MNVLTKYLRKMENNQALANAILTVVVSIMLVAVGAFVTFTFTDVMRQASTSNATNATLDQVEETSSNAFNLLLAAVIITIAVTLIGVVYYGFFRRPGDGGSGLM